MGDGRPLDLPLVAQTLDYTCGAACFDSMFRYFRGTSPGELHFAEELGTLREGYTPVERVVQLAQAYGFTGALREGASLSDLREAFARGEVIFVTWWDEDAGHYSLVKHLEGDHITLMDPWEARAQKDNRLPLDYFVPNWIRRQAKMIAVSAVP